MVGRTDMIFWDALVGEQARANAGLPHVQEGVRGYLTLGVAAGKLVLGAPWYGFDNVCAAGTAPDSRVCIKADGNRTSRSILPYETYPAPSISEIITQGLVTSHGVRCVPPPNDPALCLGGE